MLAKALSLTRVALQVITADLNKVVVELLQSLLYWQERARALHPAKAKQKKRLVSGLRSAMHSELLACFLYAVHGQLCTQTLSSLTFLPLVLSSNPKSQKTLLPRWPLRS